MRLSAACITALAVISAPTAASASAAPSTAPSMDPTFIITFDESITEAPSTAPSYLRAVNQVPSSRPSFRKVPDPFYSYRRIGGFHTLRSVLKFIIYSAAWIPAIAYFDSLDLSHLREDGEYYEKFLASLYDEPWVDDFCSRRVMDNEPQTRDMNTPMGFEDDMNYDGERMIFYTGADFLEDDVATDEIVFGIEGEHALVLSNSDCDDVHIGTWVTIDVA